MHATRAKLTADEQRDVPTECTRTIDPECVSCQVEPLDRRAAQMADGVDSRRSRRVPTRTTTITPDGQRLAAVVIIARFTGFVQRRLTERLRPP